MFNPYPPPSCFPHPELQRLHPDLLTLYILHAVMKFLLLILIMLSSSSPPICSPFFIAYQVSLPYFLGASSCPSGHCLWCFLHLCRQRAEGVRCLASPVHEVLQHSHNPHLQTEAPTNRLTIQLLFNFSFKFLALH